ncbi:hypothetical protein LA52FAK_45350 [Desulforhopalus sp. 52FAK]
MGARTGFYRNNYKVTPGLYCVGAPDNNSPVLVTANYKLSFDALRKELPGLNCWILVVDTRGINVWCAGGKGTFSAEEVAFQVQQAQLESIVTHKKLILPQLSANGVALHKLKKLCGFRGEFGPIRATDIKKFLESGKATEEMRAATFTIAERAVLIPLEICILWKQLSYITLFCFIISGISSDFYTIDQALTRGTGLTLATLVAILSGAVAAPLFLPWIPARQFWIKGVITGGIAGVLFTGALFTTPSMFDSLAIILWILGCSSYLAMNFTGSTVFTSLSGVEKEMRSGLVFQVAATALALIIWIISPFT